MNGNAGFKGRLGINSLKFWMFRAGLPLWLLCLLSTSSAQTYSVLHYFNGDDGESPYSFGGLVLSGDTLYGTTPGPRPQLRHNL